MRSLMEVGVCLSLKINAGLTGSKTLLEGEGGRGPPLLFPPLLPSSSPLHPSGRVLQAGNGSRIYANGL